MNFNDNEKIFQAKRKHHVVWGNYLARWAKNQRDVYYSTSKGKVAFDSVKGLSVYKDFYQLTVLSNDHVEIIKKWSSFSSEKMQKQHRSYLNDFLKIQNIQSFILQYGPPIEEVHRLFFSTQCNMLEDLHSAHENECQVIFAALSQEDLSILDADKNMIKFMQFFGHQVTRTRNFKENVLGGLPRNTETEIYAVKAMEHSWWFMSYLFGMNMGLAFYRSRRDDSHTLLINNTNQAFITSDQPIINVHADLKDDEFKPPDNGDYYLPISPNVAYLISESKRFPSGKFDVCIDDVTELNTKIAKKANSMIIGNDRQLVNDLLRYVGNHRRFLASVTDEQKMKFRPNK